MQTTLTPGRSFPPEERRLGFDDNGAALSVSPVLTEQLMLASEQLAADAVDNHWTALVPCTQTATDVDACGRASSPRLAGARIAGRWTPTTPRS